MSKLNSNEVLYWCHRETPFLLARIHREVRFAVQQSSWNRSGFSVLLVDASAGSEVYRLKDTSSNQATHLSLSMENCLMTNAILCFLPAVRGLDDRPRGCRVWQRAGLTTCCLTVVWYTLGSCLLQVTTQGLPRTYSTYMCCRNNITQAHDHRKVCCYTLHFKSPNQL